MDVTILRKDVINMATATVTTRQTRLNVRSGPSISHSIVGKLAKGQTIEITSDTFSEGGWTWVGYGGNWVCQKDPRYSYPFLNIQVEEATPAPAEPAPAPVTPNYDDLIAGLVSSLDNGTEIKAGKVKSINGSAVQYEDANMHELIKSIYLGKRDAIEGAVHDEIDKLHRSAQTMNRYKLTLMEMVGTFYRFCANNFIDFDNFPGLAAQ